MSNIIVECSRFDSITSLSNSSWRNSINRGITVNPGDVISLKNCFINSNTSNLSNIELAQPVQLLMNYGYYDVNYAENVNKANITNDTVDYDFYIGYVNNLGTSATLISFTVACDFRVGGSNSWQPGLGLTAEMDYQTTDGKGHTLYWGHYDYHQPTQPPAYWPQPPRNTDDISTLTVNITIPNMVRSSLQVHHLNVDDPDYIHKVSPYYVGANFQGEGQAGLGINIGRTEIIIPAGEYTPTGVAKLITDQLQLSPPMFKSNKVSVGNDLMRRTDDYFNHIGFLDDDDVGAGDEQKVVTLSGNFVNIAAVQQTGLNYDKQVMVYYVLTDATGIITTHSVSATIESQANNGIFIFGGACLIRFTANIFNVGDNYSNAYIEVQGSSALVFKRVGLDPTNVATKNYYFTQPTYYGSSENTLVYDEDRQVFSFQYLHMPYFSGAPPTIGIRIEQNNTITNPEAYRNIYTITQQSGVFFTSLEPADFWTNTLGFDLSKIVVPIGVDGVSPLAISRDELVQKITRGYSAVASLITTGVRDIPPLLGGYDVPTTDTIQLLGEQVDDTDSGGFYLVEVSCGSHQNYYYSSSHFSTISGIVSKYNQVKDFITGYSDSSIDYYHQGEPFDLQNVEIRILDPQTKKVVENLGANSSVFLQITKQLNQQIPDKTSRIENK